MDATGRDAFTRMEGISMTGADDARCRLCGGPELTEIIDFGSTPIADRLVPASLLHEPDPMAPLAVDHCGSCSLVQLRETVDPTTLFDDDYPYLSSTSRSVIDAAARHAADLIARRDLDEGSRVVEIGSNDGYMLRHFAARGIRVLGIDPAGPAADAARRAEIPTIRAFFDRELGRRLASDGGAAELVIANNVLAHVPDIHDFVGGLAALLKPNGIAIMEVPWVFDMMDRLAFDTIYHQHVYYFSLTALCDLLGRHGLTVNDVQRLDTQGGSLRLSVERTRSIGPNVTRMLAGEAARGVDRPTAYREFGRYVADHVARLRELLLDLKARGRRLAAYGAAAKGTMLLHACGLDRATVDYVVDRNEFKQGRYLPGSRLRIEPAERLLQDRPDDVLLLAWNIADEIVDQQQRYLDGGGRFVVPLPDLRFIGPNALAQSALA
jgi:SAM-dependent methyltransferase